MLIRSIPAIPVRTRLIFHILFETISGQLLVFNVISLMFF